MILEIGFGGCVAADKVLAIIDANTSPAKRMVKQAESAGKLVCATKGRKTKSLIILQGMVVVQCAYKDSSIGKRFDALRAFATPLLMDSVIGSTSEAGDYDEDEDDEEESLADDDDSDEVEDDFELDDE